LRQNLLERPLRRKRRATLPTRHIAINDSSTLFRKAE
jgi:hypothetical protein